MKSVWRGWHPNPAEFSHHFWAPTVHPVVFCRYGAEQKSCPWLRRGRRCCGAPFPVCRGAEWDHRFFDTPENRPLPFSGLLRGQSVSCPGSGRGGTLAGHRDRGTPGYYHQQRWHCLAQTQQKILSCPPDSPGQVLQVGGSPPHGDSRASSFHLTAAPPPRTLSSRAFMGHTDISGALAHWWCTSHSHSMGSSSVTRQALACGRVSNPGPTRGLKLSPPSPCQAM